MTLRPANPADLTSITGLLAACGLAADGVKEGLADFLVAGEGPPLLGVAGLERRDGGMALLRSVAVSPAHRGQGIASALCRQLHRHAGETGIDHLFLLTTTAAEFFGRLGYRPLARDAAPDPIRDTAQFRELCPASAVLMELDLRNATRKEAP